MEGENTVHAEWNTIYSSKKVRNFIICYSMAMEIVMLNGGVQIQKTEV